MAAVADEYVPASQLMHCEASVAPNDVDHVPAMQSRQDIDDEDPGMDDHDPALHDEH